MQCARRSTPRAAPRGCSWAGWDRSDDTPGRPEVISSPLSQTFSDPQLTLFPLVALFLDLNSDVILKCFCQKFLKNLYLVGNKHHDTTHKAPRLERTHHISECWLKFWLLLFQCSSQYSAPGRQSKMTRVPTWENQMGTSDSWLLPCPVPAVASNWGESHQMEDLALCLSNKNLFKKFLKNILQPMLWHSGLC